MQITRQSLLILLKDNWLHIVFVVGIVVYLAWSIYGKQPQPPSAGFVTPPPAVSQPKVNGPVLKVPLKIVPKQKVQDKFPGAHTDGPIEVVDTADIPALPNGGTGITTINTDTGATQTEIKANTAPWLSLERQNYIGVGYELHPVAGGAVKAYYKRDLIRVKDIHLQGEVSVKAPLSGGAIEGWIGGNVELRF
jgi:hypothetical protein